MQPILHRSRRCISPLALVLLCAWVGSPALLEAQSQVSWNFLGPFGAPARVVMLTADPRTDSVLYAVAPGAGIWKTTDGGQSWTPISDAISSLQVCSLAIDSRSPDVVYVGTGDNQSPRPLQGVEASSDGGRTWTIQARFTNQPVCAVAIDPTSSSRVFAGSAEGLFISSDAGITWTKAVNSPVSSIAFDNQGIAYAGTVGADSGGARDHVLIRSSDSGATWTNISLPANSFASTSQTTWVNVTIAAGAISVLVSYEPAPFLPGSSSSANSTLSVVDYYQSADGGNTWSVPARVGLARPPTQLLADATGNLYVAGSTLLTSANQGSSWVPVSTTTSDFHTSVFTGGMLLLGGEKGLESVSLAPGTTPPAISQLFAGQFLGVSLDSLNNVWTAGPGGLFGPVSPIVPSAIQQINAVGSVVATANSTDIFTAGNRQVAGSTDGGQNFSIHDVLASDELRAPFPPLLVDPVNNSSVFVAGMHVYHSTNSGEKWTALPVVDPDATHVVIALAMARATRTTLYAATACLPEVVITSCPAVSIIWRSANSGQTWTQEGSVSGYVNRLAVDPRQTNTIYAAIGAFPGGPSLSAGYVRGDLLQSTTMGSTWNSIRTNLPNVSVNAVVIDPTSLPPLTVTINPPTPGGPFGFPGGPVRTIVNQPAQTLYVATDAGVFVTFNLGGGGNTLPTPQWTDISTGLPPAPVTDITLRQPGAILVAATFGRGVYSLSTTGLGAEVVAGTLSIETNVMQGAAATVGVPLFNVSTTNPFGWRLNPRDPWLNVIQANGTIAPRASAQVPVRIAATGLQTGTYLGRLQLISGAFIQNVFVTLHVTAAPAQIKIISGNNASGMVGAALPPLQVMVTDANQNPLYGIPVSFALTTGGGSVSPSMAFTDNAGIASTVVRLPSNTGVVQLIAASGALSVTFTLSAVKLPVLLPNAVVDGVTFNQYMSPAPGSIISVSGQNLSPASLAAGPGALPQILGTTRVLLVTGANIVPLPLLSVSPGQISAMLPTDVLPGSYSIRVDSASILSNDIPLLVAPFDPGIFTQNGTGSGIGVFVKTDGSVVSAANPADRGSIITLFAAGLGAVNPPVAAGQPGALEEPFNRTVTVPRVVFDLYTASLIYSGLPAGAPIPYQVTVVVPPQLNPATNISVSLAIGGFESNRVTIPIR